MSEQSYFKQSSTQFSSICSIDRTLLGGTTTGQSGPGSNGNEWGTLHSPKLQHYWNLCIRLFRVIIRTLVAEKQSVYCTVPADCAKIFEANSSK